MADLVAEFGHEALEDSLRQGRKPVSAVDKDLLSLYTVGRPIIRKVLKIRIWGVSPACLGSYSSGPPDGGTSQILIFKT